MKLIDAFLQHLRVDLGLSVHTRDAYGRDLKQLELFLISGLQTDLLRAKPNDLSAFIAEASKKGMSPATRARKVSAVKQFYRFIFHEGLIADDPSSLLEAPKTTRSIPKALDPTYLAKILETVDEGLDYSDSTRAALRARDQALVYLLYACGLRITEILTLTLRDVDTEAGFVRVLGKRNKERLVPFPPSVAVLLVQYKAHTRETLKPCDETFFIGRRGEGLTRQAAWKTLSQIAIKCGIPSKLHPHVFRHTFATDLLRAGMGLRTLQTLLGHADLQTTQVYTSVASDTLKQVIAKFHPRG